MSFHDRADGSPLQGARRGPLALPPPTHHCRPWHQRPPRTAAPGARWRLRPLAKSARHAAAPAHGDRNLATSDHTAAAAAATSVSTGQPKQRPQVTTPICKNRQAATTGSAVTHSQAMEQHLPSCDLFLLLGETQPAWLGALPCRLTVHHRLQLMEHPQQPAAGHHWRRHHHEIRCFLLPHHHRAVSPLAAAAARRLPCSPGTLSLLWRGAGTPAGVLQPVPATTPPPAHAGWALGPL